MIANFGGPANSGSPVTLRPSLTRGLPFRLATKRNNAPLTCASQGTGGYERRLQPTCNRGATKCGDFRPAFGPARNSAIPAGELDDPCARKARATGPRCTRRTNVRRSDRRAVACDHAAVPRAPCLSSRSGGTPHVVGRVAVPCRFLRTPPGPLCPATTVDNHAIGWVSRGGGYTALVGSERVDRCSSPTTCLPGP
jgi:hypothetical protein